MSAVVDMRSAATVFADRRGGGWWASGLVHLGAFVALAFAAMRVRAPVEHHAPAVVEFESPPPRRESPPPPPPPEPPPQTETPPPTSQARVAPTPHAPRAARVSAPPPIMTSQSHDATGTAPSGENTAFHGGDVGTQTDSPPAPDPAPPAAPVPPPPVAEAPRGPVQLPENASPPEPLDGNASPEYPAAARSSGVQATVVARIVVNADGSVGRVEILRGHPEFDAVVETALRRWRYRPATVDGHAIAVFQVVRIPFRLENL